MVADKEECRHENVQMAHAGKTMLYTRMVADKNEHLMPTHVVAYEMGVL